ncbi:FAS-associated death domain protein [Hyla sarda]|uniref:FAS-associated death domain protein n=1 Tax=Hyla sarda TaxID=327740 RepID=UPI0024C2706B|nr:FAS-associated death domain protein [Hyla sarda]
MERVDKCSVLLLRISEKLNNEELEGMKFLCQKQIVKKKMETITSPIHLFRHLKELTEISEDDLGFLVVLLNTINRPDLAQEVERFHSPPSRVEAGERDHLDQAFDIICDNVGRDWKKLIRSLGVSESTIEQVVYANPNNMREQLQQCLNEWKKKRKDGATISVLVKALENCRMRLVSERITEAINLSHGAS